MGWWGNEGRGWERRGRAGLECSSLLVKGFWKPSPAFKSPGAPCHPPPRHPLGKRAHILGALLVGDLDLLVLWKSGGPVLLFSIPGPRSSPQLSAVSTPIKRKLWKRFLKYPCAYTAHGLLNVFLMSHFF